MNESSGAVLRLYHAPSSYYSMIARLALAENSVAYQPVFVDIHARMTQQSPDYVRINRGMTVPTLVGPGLCLTESRAIALHAFGLQETDLDDDSRAWLDRHYSFPIEELTFGRLLKRNPLARFLIPKRLEAARRRLLALAKQNPELAEFYKARADVFASRTIAFDPNLLPALFEHRRSEAIGALERLEFALSDGRPMIVLPRFGIVDVVWIVFLARMKFAGFEDEVDKRPALSRYWLAAQSRPSFAAADIWTSLHFGRLVAGIVGLRI